MKNITLPLTEQTILSLKAGDTVTLSGVVYSARDAAHKRLFDAISSGSTLPFDLKDAAIYYVGACPPLPGDAIGSCGPTTSSRMDNYTPALLDLGVKALIGKGKRCPAVTESLKKNKAVYFAAIGGAGAYYADCVKKRTPIAYPELLSEAVEKLTIENFPVVVAIDCEGNSVYR